MLGSLLVCMYMCVYFRNIYIFLKKFAKIIDFSKIFIELHSIYFKTVPLLPPKD